MPERIAILNVVGLTASLVGPHTPRLQQAAQAGGATVFAAQVSNPQRYGIIAFDADGRASSIEEKPEKPKSNWSVTGLYFYDGRASQLARSLTRSARGELEITDLNRRYLEAGIVDQFGINGCPVFFDLVGKEKHEPGTPYSGKFDFIKTQMDWPITHMVAPKDKALGCVQCHAKDGRLAGLPGIYMPGASADRTTAHSSAQSIHRRWRV